MTIYKLIATLIFIFNGYDSLAQFCCHRIEISIRDGSSSYMEDSIWTSDYVRVRNDYKIIFNGKIRTTELCNVYENLVSQVDNKKVGLQYTTSDPTRVRVVVDFIVSERIDKSLFFYTNNSWSYESYYKSKVYEPDYEILCALNRLFPKTFLIEDEERLCEPN